MPPIRNGLGCVYRLVRHFAWCKMAFVQLLSHGGSKLGNRLQDWSNDFGPSDFYSVSKTWNYFQININANLLSPCFRLSDELRSRIRQVVSEIAHIKFPSRKSPYKAYGSRRVWKVTLRTWHRVQRDCLLVSCDRK